MALKALQELLTVQQPLLGQSFDAVMEAQCTNMAALFQNNPITMDESTELNAMIAAGPWTQQQKEKLATLLASQLVNTMKETSTGKAKRKQNQELRNLYGYLTAEDKAILSAQSSLCIVACRMRRMCAANFSYYGHRNKRLATAEHRRAFQ